MKTLGEIAYETANPYDPDAQVNPCRWSEIEANHRQYWEASASAVRKAVLEEAIEVINNLDPETGDTPKSYYAALNDALEALQQLFDKDVSCNQQAQVDQSVSAPGEPLQSDISREAEG